jgi:cytochrome c2
MRQKKKIAIILLILVFVFTLVLAQVLWSQQKEEPKKELTAFEQRCSICHSLNDVREGMEKIIEEMHQKAGVGISRRSLKEIEATFTLFPRLEPEKGLFQEKCGSCHSLAVVVKAHQTMDEKEMEDVIKKMAEKEKSGISEDEIKKIHQSMNILNEIYEEDVEVKPENNE